MYIARLFWITSARSRMELRHVSLTRVIWWWVVIGLLTVGCYSEANVSTMAVTASNSPTVTPTLTLISSLEVTSTSHPVSTSSKKPDPPTPTPTPKPGNDFLTYRDDHLYLKIHNITIKFESPDYSILTGEAIDKMKILNDTISSPNSDGQEIVYKRFYGTKQNPRFYIAFDFKLNPSEDNPTWYMYNFQHRYLDGNDSTILFQYKGIELSIYAPTDLTYHCNDVQLHGSGGVEDVIKTSVNFTVLQVQPFLNKKQPSNTYFDCAHHSTNNNTIGLAVGLSIAVLVVIAVIVIIGSFVVSKRVSNRGYDILKS